MQSRLVQSIALFLMGVCVLPQVGAQTSPTPPAARAVPPQTPAQRMEAAQNLSSTEADSALAQLNVYRKAMGLSVLVKNEPLTTAASRHSLYRSVILAYSQHLGTWVWTSVAGSNKKSVEDSALTGCRQMASKEGIAEPCLIY